MKKLTLLIFLSVLFVDAHAQIGGISTFKFLDLVPSARAAALGGNAIATHVDDVSLVWQNPALLSKEMNNQFQISFADYFEKINFGQLAYAHDFNQSGVGAATFHYISYGTFKMTDEAANDLGTFSAGEYALSLSWGKALDSLFYIGTSLKGIYSDLETYTSWGLAADVGGLYVSKSKFFCMALTARNIGRQMNKYDLSGTEPLPFEMQFGFTKQLPKAPFRFGVIWQHLEKFDLTYTDPSLPTVDPLTGEAVDNSVSFGKKCLRHLVLNSEILFSKNFNLRLGYNFERRAEMMMENKKGLVGMSIGVGIKISKFKLDYARSAYHIKGASNQFTLGFKLADFAKK